MNPFKTALDRCFRASSSSTHPHPNNLSTTFRHVLSLSSDRPAPAPPAPPHSAPASQPRYSPSAPLTSTTATAAAAAAAAAAATATATDAATARPSQQQQPKSVAPRQPPTGPATCMSGAIKRKLSLPSLAPAHPPSACHVHAFAPLKRPRRDNMVRLLDLSDDLLLNIITHVMTPAKEGNRTIITEESIRSSLPLATTCHALYHIWRASMNDLELWVSGNLDDRGLSAICAANGPRIHRLGLRRSTQLSHPALAAIPRHCTRLRSLDMSHTHVTDDFIIRLTAATGRSLQFLALHACTNLTPRALRAIADACPHLRFLDIGAIPAVDDPTIAYLARRLGPSVRTMVLSNCPSLSDAAMAQIGAHCSSLMSLTIRGLASITDDGLQKLCAGIGDRVQILDVLDCTGLTMGGYFATMETHCPHVFRYLEESNYVEHLGERCLRDNIIATMPGLIYRISATDAIRRLPALYFLLLDESTLRPFRVSVQSKSLNLSDFGTVLISNFGKRPTQKTRSVLLSRFGYDSPFDSESDDESCDRA